MINYIPVKISSTKYTNNRMLSLNTTLFINYRAVCCKIEFLPRTYCLSQEQCFSYFHNHLKNIHFLAKYALAPGSSAYWRFFPLWAQLLWMLFMVLLWQVWRAGMVKDVSLAYLLSVWICYRIVNDPVSWHSLTTSKTSFFHFILYDNFLTQSDKSLGA